ncbi:MAG: methionyl-tRNA formyltransferase [Bacillota bacterium]|jgi:methionyl-tRNA formyltransferase|nr:methionyl-tRNA formyltransferase [Bacillota bacterium]MDY0118291.1 methionyl-tRNA formyltransferase [Bacilli bacterium]
MTKSKSIRIVYLGTPEMSAALLEKLINLGLNIVGVVAQPDKPVGRKRLVLDVPTKVVAKKHGIPVFQPHRIRSDFSFLSETKPDLILCFAYGQIIPSEVINYPRYGCLNYHGSLLPKYRGAAPIQYALMNNDKETGVTLMEMVEKMDAGRMYAKKKFLIEPKDDFSNLANKMVDAAFDLTVESLEKYLNGELVGEEQNEELVTFAPSIKPEEEQVSVLDDIEVIVGKVRALSPSPGTKIRMDEEEIKLFKVEIVSRENLAPLGSVIQANKSGFYIQVNGGILSLLRLQRGGRVILSYKDFLNGLQDPETRVFK